MENEKIWQKVLSENEKIMYEFSISDRYLIVCMLFWALLGLVVVAFSKLGMGIIIISLLYYGFYLKAANAYAFTDKRVLAHKGWLSTHLVSVEYSKISDIHISEPFFCNLIFGTGSMAIITAGSTSDQIVLSRIASPYEVRKKLDSLMEEKSKEIEQNK